MTIYYVDSAAGGNIAPYDTWANAATKLATIAAIDVAGDTVYVASTHAETNLGAVNLAWAGTPTNPTRIICADKTSGEPPTTIATGASLAYINLGSAVIQLNSSAGTVYIYGLTVTTNSNSGGTVIIVGTRTYAEQCSFQNLDAANHNGVIDLTGSYLKNCTMSFTSANSVNGVVAAINTWWSGGSFLGGTASPPALFNTISNASHVIIENVDFTNLSSALNLVANIGTSALVIFRKCKMPAAWSGTIVGSAFFAANALGWSAADLIDCDNSGTNYVYHRAELLGDITHETTLVRSGGASNGTTALSWKMVSTSSAGLFPITAMKSAEFEIWNDAFGSPMTATVEYLHDSVTGLKNNEIWIEVRYTKDFFDPLGDTASGAPADVLAAASTNAASSASWTTTGMTNPNKQSMSVTFTPAQAGPVYVSVHMAKASYTAYVDPVVTLA